MLRTYLPAIVFVLLGTGVGAAFAVLNTLFGPKGKEDVKSKADPYECGLPSEVKQGFRFGISFYLVAMLFILFDIEAIFMFPWAVMFKQLKVFGLIEMFSFLGFLLIGYVYLWRRGALEWD